MNKPLLWVCEKVQTLFWEAQAGCQLGLSTADTAKFAAAHIWHVAPNPAIWAHQLFASALRFKMAQLVARGAWPVAHRDALTNTWYSGAGSLI